MKKFLTVSTFCLAIAGVATTKANSKIAPIPGYTEDPIAHTCTVVSGTDCDGTQFNCLSTSNQQLFAFDASNPCQTQLKKD